MNVRHVLLTAVAVALSLSAPAHAQSPWSVEGRLGSTIPTGELSDDLNQTAGLAFSADLLYSLNPALSIYGGVGRHGFNCDGCDADVKSFGFDAGGKFLLGRDGAALPWVRAGLMLHRPEVEDTDGDWGVGLDSGVGIDWAVSDRLTVVPALRYNRYSPEATTLSYMTIDLAAHLHFGG